MKFCVSIVWTRPEDCCALAQAAEEHGWDTLVVSDHVVHLESIRSRYPYRQDGERPWQALDPWPDPWVAIGAMGAVTSRIRFLTAVYVVPMRHPLHLAKALGTAAVMTGGRVSLGMGLGWMREEFELLGADFGTRAARADEMLEIMRKLWSGDWIEHRGRFYELPRLNMRPAVPASVPVVVGGTSDAALRRAARLGDGWLPNSRPLSEVAADLDRLRSYRRELGREGMPFSVVAPLTDANGLDDYRRAEDLGITHILASPWGFYGSGPLTLAQRKDALARFADRVIARL